MNQLKQQVKEIFAKDYGGNSLVIADMHYFLNEKQYSKAKKIMTKDLSLSNDEANILISYYKKKMESKVKIVEITVNDVTYSDSDNPIDNEQYLFLYGQSIHCSTVYKSYQGEGLDFYANKEFHNIAKARQIWHIKWDF